MSGAFAYGWPALDRDFAAVVAIAPCPFQCDRLPFQSQTETAMSDRIIMRVGEALVAGGPPGTAAEPEVIIGELDGPFGSAFAKLLGDQVVGHTRVLALLNTDVM